MVAELIAGGIVAGALFWLTYCAIDRQLTLVGYDRLGSPLFPPDLAVLTAHAGRLFLAFASFWSVTAILARLAERWRISWRRHRTRGTGTAPSGTRSTAGKASTCRATTAG